MRVKKISFVIPTYNEEKRLRKCLQSIIGQNYPKESIEIILADGGSTDKTCEIAKSYGALVFFNKLKLAEPGVYLGASKATGDFICIMAVDNILPNKHWITSMIKPFEDPKIVASFTHVVNDSHDNAFSKYFNSLHADPFNEFVYGSAVNPKNYHLLYSVKKKTKEYVVYDYLNNPPLIAMAQGFTYRRSLFRKKDNQYDDIEPIYEMLKNKKEIAYVFTTGIYHYSFSGFWNFVKKYDTRTINALKHGYVKRSKNFPFFYKVRQYLWFPYSISIILPLIVMIKKMIQEKKLYFLYHPVACFVLTCVIIRRILIEKI